MTEKTSRCAWLAFLERTVFRYIQCMFDSSKKIKASSAAKAIAQMKDHSQKIEERF